MTSTTNPLGDFLRARRERVDPASLGLSTIGPRRTPGLRREELASLAGISVEYLVRLERGRDRNPSPAVVQSLADVLGLDEGARQHLAALADVRVYQSYDDNEVAAELLDLISDWPQPALVMNRFMDLLAVNSAAAPMHEALGLAPGDNLTRSVFVDPRAPELYPDFDDVAAEAVANLRALAGHEPAHPRLQALVGELSVASPLFARLWSRNEVLAKSTGQKRIDVPGVGLLTLRWDSLAVTAAPGQLVVAYQPADNSTAERLMQLDARYSTQRRSSGH